MAQRVGHDLAGDIEGNLPPAFAESMTANRHQPTPHQADQDQIQKQKPAEKYRRVCLLSEPGHF
jgi:hypothetical protein